MLSSRSYRCCPLCGHTEIQNLYKMHLAYVDEENLPLDFYISRCTRCGFFFDNIDACQNDFDNYYASTIKYQHPDTCGSGNMSAAACERYHRVYNMCKEYIRDDDYILDIGAGKGGLLRYISKSNGRLYAVEPSMNSAKEHDGIKFFKNIEEIIGENIKFNFIFCTHVMEHIYDLHVFIEKIKCVSKEDTLIYIEVPNASEYINGQRAPFYYFDREHINHFTPISLKNLFLLHGFEDVSYESKNNISILFKKSTKSGKSELEYDPYAQNISAYIDQSRILDSKITFRNISWPIILWGFGAYLRRIILTPDFPHPIAAIIDRDRGGKGLMWNNIPLVTADVLAEESFSKATVLITSVLYAEEIKKEIAAMNFQGTVLTAF